MELMDELSLVRMISTSCRILEVADIGRVPGWKRNLWTGSWENLFGRTYDKESQNTFRENISSEQKNEESIAAEDNQSFFGNFFAVKEDDYDQNVVLDQ